METKKEEYIKNKLDSIYNLVDKIDDDVRLKLKRQMSDEVKQNIIWASTLIILAIIITIAIVL